jgi:hypothetical protein
MRTLTAAFLALFAAACAEAEGGKLDITGWQIELSVSPYRQTYLPGELVNVRAEVRDAKGSVVVGHELEWSASGAVSEADSKFRLNAFESLASITACLVTDEGSLCGSAELPVDIAPPTVIVTSPEPGAHLLSSESDGNIQVEGSIFDTNPHAKLSVYVNGHRASIEPDGRFELALPAEFGVTHLVIEGSDGFHAPTMTQMDVLMADGYLPPHEGTTRFELQDALVIRLGQTFFDELLGGSSLNLGASPVVARDIAAILELVLLNLDLSSLFGPGPIFDFGDTFQLSIVSVSVGDAVADLAIAQHQGLGLTLNVNDVFIEMSGFLNLLGENFVIAGGVRTDVRGTIRLDLGIDAEGQLASSVVVEEFDIGSIYPMFSGSDGTFFNEFIDLPTIQMTFAELVRDQIGGEIVEELVGVIPAMLVDVLNGIGGIFAGLEIELPLPPELGDPLTVQLDSRLAGVAWLAGADTGRVDAAIDLSIETAAPPLHGDAPGLPQADVTPTPPFSSALGLQLAIRQDVVNALLHSLWNAGLLDVEVNVGGIAAVVTPRLPPVMKMAPMSTTCAIDGVRCDAIVQLGQVEVSALGAVSAVSLEAGVGLDFRDGAISLKLQQDPAITLWEVQRSTTSALLNGFLLSFLQSDILPALTSLVGEELTIALPLPDPTSLGLEEIAPALADATLEVSALGRIDAASGYLGLGADVSFVVP